MPTLEIHNNGGEITSSNFWTLSGDKFYLSTNAAVFRLLVPDSLAAAVSEMKTGKKVIVSRGPWPLERQTEALELLFDDDTDTPFCLHLGQGSFDRLPLDEDCGRELLLSVWLSGPRKTLELPAFYRRVAQLPWMKPL